MSQTLQQLRLRLRNSQLLHSYIIIIILMGYTPTHIYIYIQARK